METVDYTPANFNYDVNLLAERLRKSDVEPVAFMGIPRGGVPLAVALASRFPDAILVGPEEVELVEATLDRGKNQVIVVCDDIVATGKTMLKWVLSGERIGCSIHVREGTSYTPDLSSRIARGWINYFWEAGDPMACIADSVTRVLEYIGEDPMREGLVETPKRVVASWGKLYGGYRQKASDVVKVFTDPFADQMVLLKDIEFYSMCEHHMLPFFGKAHVAYLPNKQKVIGVSKIARIVEVFARRLQIQERLTCQIADALNEVLQPLGTACVLEAQHLCMVSRGIEKQNSVMVTSHLTGAFREDRDLRNEFLSIVGR